MQNKTGEVGRDIYIIDFYPQQYKTSTVFSKELVIVFHLMRNSDWRVLERRQGEQLGTLVLSIGRRPQLLPMRASLRSGLGVCTTQWLPSLRASNSRGQGRICNIFFFFVNSMWNMVEGINNSRIQLITWFGVFPSLGFFFFNFYWCIIDLQCCISFRCTAKWISYIYMYIHFFFLVFFSHISHYRVFNRIPCAIL